jgi:hypothetical protein
MNNGANNWDWADEADKKFEADKGKHFVPAWGAFASEEMEAEAEAESEADAEQE